MHRPYLLFKFGEPDHMQKLLDGYLYMNTWSYFKDAENPVERDFGEGVHRWIQPDQTEIRIGGHVLTKEGGTIDATLSFEQSETKIFCASSYFRALDRRTGAIFDDRVLKHGASLVVIHDLAKFFGQVGSSIKDLINRQILESSEAGMVRYFDERNYDGDVGPFMKRCQFSYEKEWRLTVRTKSKENRHFCLEVGDLNHCAKILKTADFRNYIELKDDGSVTVYI